LNIPEITKHVKMLVRFLDNVNEYSSAPLPEYIEAMRHKRRIGCGVLGWGSALFMMKVKFGSPEAETIRTNLMQAYARAAYEASIDLAIEKGMFTYCVPEKHAECPFVQSLGLSEDYMQKLRTTGIRNSSLLSQQPTGNTSILANVVSGGIEPIFMPEYIRTVIVPSMPEDMKTFTPKWYEGEWYETNVFKETKEGDEPILKGVFNGTTYKIDKNRGLLKEVLCEDYGVRWLKARGEWEPDADWAVTTTELSVQAHVDDLKGFAQYTDSACSKTVNIPNEYPYEDFKNLYLDVYNTGYIKGFTTYRSGTMASVLSANTKDENSDEEIILDDVKLPDSLPAVVKRLKAEGKKWYVTAIMDEAHKSPVALFVHTNHPEKGATTQNAVDVLFKLARDKGIPEKFVKEIEDKVAADSNPSKIARAISLCLRHGVRVKSVVGALDNVQDVFVGSFLFAIRKYLGSFIKDGEVVADAKCDECGGTLVYEEGCQKCSNCGASKCG
jgi:ribonucleoside-diphosphate reductase alpha chain